MLTVCPTPIGNLDDVTERQRTALAESDVVACEDTRRTGKLLERLGIERDDGRPRLVAYHEHNESEAAERLASALERGRDVVLVSDAGTPLLSDPGFELVRAALERGIEVEPLPGPFAGVVALVASGLPTHAFQFRGFPPSSSEARRRFLRAVDTDDMTTVLYESVHRIEELLGDIVEVYGPTRSVCVAREMTKMHEDFLRGPVEEVLKDLEDATRGECTVVVAPAPEQEDAAEGEADEKIRELLERGFRARTIKEIVSELYDIPRSELYDRIEAIEGE